jgi:hypothetical protein
VTDADEASLAPGSTLRSEPLLLLPGAVLADSCPRNRRRSRCLDLRKDGGVELLYGARKLDRVVRELDELAAEWRVREADWGQLYLEFVPSTPPDKLLVEDLAATMLINSRAAGQAAAALHRRGHELDLRSVRDKPLEETTSDERDRAAELISTMTSWPWVGASLATKTLHKKRPRLIPVLDNQAIFGAYMNPAWPAKRSLAETIKGQARIREALEWIYVDLTRSENQASWSWLETIEPERTRIELFDIVWWMYFRRVEPVSVPQ